jgi:hypothetical protein
VKILTNWFIEEFATAIEQIGRRDLFKWLEIDPLEIWVVGDEKALEVVVEKSIQIARKFKPAIGGQEPLMTTFETMTRLYEMLPVRLEGMAEIEAQDQLVGRGVDRARRQRGVRLAWEELQCALEWFSGLGGGGLETATIGILDVVFGGKCELCNHSHRNGKCWVHMSSERAV